MKSIKISLYWTLTLCKAWTEWFKNLQHQQQLVLDRKAESQVQTCWITICCLTRYPGDPNCTLKSKCTNLVHIYVISLEEQEAKWLLILISLLSNLHGLSNGLIPILKVGENFASYSKLLKCYPRSCKSYNKIDSSVRFLISFLGMLS